MCLRSLTIFYKLILVYLATLTHTQIHKYRHILILSHRQQYSVHNTENTSRIHFWGLKQTFIQCKRLPVFRVKRPYMFTGSSLTLPTHIDSCHSFVSSNLSQTREDCSFSTVIFRAFCWMHHHHHQGESFQGIFIGFQRSEPIILLLYCGRFVYIRH